MVLAVCGLTAATDPPTSPSAAFGYDPLAPEANGGGSVAAQVSGNNGGAQTNWHMVHAANGGNSRMDMRMKIMTIVKPDKTTINVATHGDWQVGQLKHQIELDTNNAFVANNFKLVDPNHPFKALNEYRTLSYYLPGATAGGTLEMELKRHVDRASDGVCHADHVKCALYVNADGHEILTHHMEKGYMSYGGRFLCYRVPASGPFGTRTCECKCTNTNYIPAATAFSHHKQRSAC